MNDPIQLVCAVCGAINRAPLARLGQRPNCGKCHRPLFQGKPFELDQPAFERHVRVDGLPLVVDFWAPWCGPCRAMAPHFEAAARQLEPDMRLAKVNTESEPELAGNFGIRSIPTLVLLSRGREVGRQAGAFTSAAQIEQWARSIAAAN